MQLDQRVTPMKRYIRMICEREGVPPYKSRLCHYTQKNYALCSAIADIRAHQDGGHCYIKVMHLGLVTNEANTEEA